MAPSDWQPTADRQMLETRADLLRQIRLFFADRQVLEVDTPILATTIGTDTALDPVRASFTLDGREQTGYLQTSPEFPMKRLLAAGSGPIFQLARSFRNGEAGNRHNHEFLMLEWYRPGFSLEALIDETEALVSKLLGLAPAVRTSYRALFLDYLGIDPWQASLPDLQQQARARLDIAFTSTNPDHWLDLLYSHCIEPQLQQPVFISDYPATQAALAQLASDDDGHTVARRFELVAGGMELANGYLELLDAGEQRDRFQRDLDNRRALGLPVVPVDERLLAALASGLPPCAGVAVGVDRLLMLKTGKTRLREVMPFPIDRV